MADGDGGRQIVEVRSPMFGLVGLEMFFCLIKDACRRRFSPSHLMFENSSHVSNYISCLAPPQVSNHISGLDSDLIVGKTIVLCQFQLNLKAFFGGIRGQLGGNFNSCSRAG